MLEMGLAKVYPSTEFEVSSFTRSRFMEGGLKFKNSAPGPWPLPLWGHFVVLEMALARIYPCTKFEVSSFTRSKDTAHVPSAVKWLDAREVVQTRAWISVVFYRTTIKSIINIVEWSMLYANVLDFRYVFASSNYGANCLRLGTKVQFLFFSAPVRFRGTLKKSV